MKVKIFGIMEKELGQFLLSSKIVTEQKISQASWWGMGLTTSTSLASGRRKVSQVSPNKRYQRNKTSTPNTVFYYAPASWHSNFFAYLFSKRLKFSLVILKCSLSHPETELSNIVRNIGVTENACLSRFSPHLFFIV